MPQRPKSLVTAFNLVPVVEQVLPDRQKVEVSVIMLWFRGRKCSIQCPTTSLNQPCLAPLATQAVAYKH